MAAGVPEAPGYFVFFICQLQSSRLSACKQKRKYHQTQFILKFILLLLANQRLIVKLIFTPENKSQEQRCFLY